jgi:chloramphenicol 3-O phosphotransferase
VAAANPGQIVILNGAPRSGKSSIVSVIQDTFDGIWMNLGVDVFVRHVTPQKIQPGIGLRPGEHDHAAVPHIAALYAALYDSIAAHSRRGFNVVTDLDHHGATQPMLREGARQLAGLPVLFVGIRCPIDVIIKRRIATGWQPAGTEHDPVPPPIALWQREVHIPGIYDLEVDTSVLSPEACAAAIRRRLDEGPPPSAFPWLAAM